MAIRRVRLAATTAILLSSLLGGCSFMEDLLGISEPVEIDSVDPDSGIRSSGDDSLNLGLRSDEGDIQLSPPLNWQQTEGLHRNADLQLARPAEDLYTLVLAEDKNNLDKFTLENNATTYRRLLIGGLDQFIEETPTEVDLVNSNNAVQYVIEGIYDEVPITYLHTTVATQRAYYQIISWTQADQFDQHVDEFQQIANSFREN